MKIEHENNSARAEYVRRAGCALVWGLAGHNKKSADDVFQARLPVIESCAFDPRDHVWKAASMALRSTAQRSDTLREDVFVIGKRLSNEDEKHTARVGREVIKALS
ncbi:MAG: hypothetical protein HRU32_02355 [Rhodobacteraceae bacterium]|nr:hypothetical protein [Paracoccaceae bacterium]